MAKTPPGPLVAPDPVLDLAFGVEDAGTLQYAASPTLRFGLRITADAGRPVRSVMLDVQLQIASRRRPYGAAEKGRLADLFGPPENFGTALRTLLWTRLTKVVPSFDGETLVDLHVPCTYDFDVHAAKYLSSLENGEVPLEFLFSGTVLYSNSDGLLQTARISWDKEAEYRLPVRVWRETMDSYFPGSAWLRLSRDTFDRLHAYRARNAYPTWEHAFDALLAGNEAEREA